LLTLACPATGVAMGATTRVGSDVGVYWGKARVEVVRVRRRERRVRVGEGIVCDGDECDGRLRDGKEG
jgi:hypothetical protein